MVGIPIQKTQITSKFLQILDDIKNGNSIGITTVDYLYPTDLNVNNHVESISSPAGHKLLFNKLKFIKYEDKLTLNSINTLGFIWNKFGHFQHDMLTEYLINILDNGHQNLKFDNVYIFCTGSPYFENMLTQTIPKYRKMQVIDTKSSFDICVDAMCAELDETPKVIHHRYNREFINNNNHYINLECLNIFSSIRDYYVPNVSTVFVVEHFFNTMDKLVHPDSIFLLCNVSEETIILKKIKYNDSKIYYKEEIKKPIPFLIGIYKGQI
jgi:hypothetical protein